MQNARRCSHHRSLRAGLIRTVVAQGDHGRIWEYRDVKAHRFLRLAVEHQEWCDVGFHDLCAVLLESFVERERFRGSCYRAANWICVGQTQGRTRQDRQRRTQAPVKDIWVYPLQANFRKPLCHVHA